MFDRKKDTMAKKQQGGRPGQQVPSKAYKKAAATGGEAIAKAPETPRLKKEYLDHVRDDLQKQFGYKNVMQIPRIEKIVVNMGVGEAATDSKAIDGAIADLRAITGQQPLVTHARKSIATFKLRAGMAIGAKVTLRGDRMWEFLDRLISTAIPRIRDFRGLPATSFDGHGNYSMGVTEQLIFPEIDYDKIDHTRGMDITIVTTAPTNEEAKALLTAFHFPFKNN
jgi:large subunit ribosomal protein L5